MNLSLPLLPPHDEMLSAFLNCDASYEGVFFTAVLTTRIFCRPTCTARKPLPENVTFYSSASEAIENGFRPCLRCKPLEMEGERPDWIKPLLDAVEQDPYARWTHAEIEQFKLSPARVRAWCKQQFGTTFSDYVRTQRLGHALDQLKVGESIDNVAVDAGYESVSGFRDAFAKAFGVPPGQAAQRKLLKYRHLQTPLGPMLAMAEAEGVVMLEFVDRPALPKELEDLKRFGYAAVPGDNPHLQQLQIELQQYFVGQLSQFTVPLIAPGTEFEKATWDGLLKIPYGTTCSYAQLAQSIGRPSSIRAVANANGRNRLAILIPCHRVIASDRTLGGYGGGVARKSKLLKIESQACAFKTIYTPMSPA